MSSNGIGNLQIETVEGPFRRKTEMVQSLYDHVRTVLDGQPGWVQFTFEDAATATRVSYSLRSRIKAERTGRWYQVSFRDNQVRARRIAAPAESLAMSDNRV